MVARLVASKASEVMSEVSRLLEPGSMDDHLRWAPVWQLVENPVHTSEAKVLIVSLVCLIACAWQMRFVDIVSGTWVEFGSIVKLYCFAGIFNTMVDYFICACSTDTTLISAVIEYTMWFVCSTDQDFSNLIPHLWIHSSRKVLVLWLKRLGKSGCCMRLRGVTS